jgi:two-component system, NtrC family, response regulator AtoC
MRSEKQLLIIDDEENMRHMLRALISRHGYAVEAVADGEEALALIQKKRFDFILCDVRMARMDGLAFLKAGFDFLADSTVIMMSAYGSVDMALEAMKAGAYDFISKPFKADEVLLTLKKAEEREGLRQENRKLKKQIQVIREGDGFSALVAKSKSMHDLLAMARKVAPFDTTVLIVGESGTGKELVARGIYTASRRAEGPFLAVNCGGIPENLLESEFFGYIKGAFTGADKAHRGIFAEADGGTLFLDEIGELPLGMQVKLLRVLQEGEIRPVGASKIEKVDVRILAATAKNLGAEVERGTFREDLYYRLNVMTITLPPLRERYEDVPLLCSHFIKKFFSLSGNTTISITPDAMEILLSYNWPGNVRELENVIQRGVVLADNGVIDLEQLPSQLIGAISKEDFEQYLTGFSLKKAQKIMEKQMIAKVLKQSGGNKMQASRLLEISYPSLLSKIKEYGVELGGKN